MTTLQIPIVQPSDLGAQFVLDPASTKWKIVGVGPASEAGNLLVAGTDGAPLLTKSAVQSNQITYTFAFNSSTKLIDLIDSTGSIVSSINPAVFQGELDGVSINNSQVTFSDTVAGHALSVDFSTFLTKVALANTNAIGLSGDGTALNPLTASLTVDPVAGNLVKVGVNGVSVNTADILALLNSATTVGLTSSANTLSLTVDGHTATANIINSNSLSVDSANGVINSSVNGIAATAGAVELVDSAGTHIAYAFA